MSQLITAREAANMLGIQISTIRALLWRGRIPATQQGRQYWITLEAVKQYQTEQPRHRERKQRPIKPARPNASTRFWAKVDQSGGPDACWPWMGWRDSKGYGRFTSKPGRTGYAHRFAWEDTNGPIPDGMGVLHRCDEPPCCNPTHHFLGTRADNNRDRDAKGRHIAGMRGKPGPGRRFTPQEVQQIRAEYIPHKVTIANLAEKYHVHFNTMYSIIHGFTYKNLG